MPPIVALRQTVLRCLRGSSFSGDLIWPPQAFDGERKRERTHQNQAKQWLFVHACADRLRFQHVSQQRARTWTTEPHHDEQTTTMPHSERKCFDFRMLPTPT